jgi:hypothetical protein
MILDNMSGSVIYSAIDLTDGFYQILMRESDVPLTTVSTQRYALGLVGDAAGSEERTSHFHPHSISHPATTPSLRAELLRRHLRAQSR